MARSLAPSQLSVDGRLQQLLDLLVLHEPRQLLVLLGRADRGHRVGGHLPGLDQVLVEAPQRGQLAGDRGLGVSLLIEQGQVGPGLVDVHGQQQMIQGHLGLGSHGRRGASIAKVAIRRVPLVVPVVEMTVARGGQELAELHQVGAIALGRMFRETPLKSEVVQESFDHGNCLFHNEPAYMHLIARPSLAFRFEATYPCMTGGLQQCLVPPRYGADDEGASSWISFSAWPISDWVNLKLNTAASNQSKLVRPALGLVDQGVEQFLFASVFITEDELLRALVEHQLSLDLVHLSSLPCCHSQPDDVHEVLHHFYRPITPSALDSDHKILAGSDEKLSDVGKGIGRRVVAWEPNGGRGAANWVYR